LEAAKAVAAAGNEIKGLVVKVSAKNLQKDEVEEVWYNNRLYDVVKREKLKDTMYVFLVADDDEQNVLDIGAGYFQKNEANTTAGNCSQLLNKKDSFKFDDNYISYPPSPEIVYFFISLPLTVNDILIHLLNESEVPNPPPEQVAQV